MNINFKFLGQCGFIISTDDLKIAIDPCLNDLIENGTTIRNYPAVMDPENLNADYIFCTHDHIDHLAPETICRAAKNSNTKFIVPKGCVKILTDLGIENFRITSVSDNQTVDFEKFSVKGISTAHPVHQLDCDGNDWNLAYCIYLDGKKLVHLGDTYGTSRLEKSLKDLGAIDCLMTPINGMDEQKAKAGIIGNLSIEEAVSITALLCPKSVIPTHFDMVKGNTADPQKFLEQMNKKNPGIKVYIPDLKNDIQI